MVKKQGAIRKGEGVVKPTKEPSNKPPKQDFKMNKSNIPFTRMIVQLPLDDGEPPHPPKEYYTVGWVICHPDRCEAFSSSCSSCKLDLVKKGLPAYDEERKKYKAKKSGIILP